MKRLASLAAATLVGMLCLPVTSSPASAATANPPQLKVMPLGDSITRGYMSTPENGYRAKLQQLVSQQSRYTVNMVGSVRNGTLADPESEGHSGYEIQGIRAELDGWLAAAQPDVVLLHIGINDLNNKHDVDANGNTAVDRAKALINQIFADRPNVTVIVQGLIRSTAGIPEQPGITAKIDDYNSQLKTWVNQERTKRHVRFVDSTVPADQLADKLHPNADGYDTFGRTFYSELDQAFSDGWIVGGPPTALTTPARTAAGDFNGDGKQDVAGIDANNDLRLYTGDGAGHVGGGSPMLGTGGAWSGFKLIAAGDFNGDGKQDVAGIDANNSLKLYVGNGAGTVSGGSAMLGGNGAWAGFKAITAGDFNGDGKQDIAGIDANDSLKLYAGNGAGQLSEVGAMLGGNGTWAGFKAITAGDFNGDGKRDVAGIDANNDLKLYTGNGAGQLGGGSLMLGSGGAWANFHAVMGADFNGDGKQDIAGIDANNDLKLYTGNGAGQLGGGSVMIGTSGSGLWAGF
ncbi:FG-GAP-like repeat-containing protein [Kitasatospora albolonga]|uniref:FG-GAP-like repeat-containing protein n=1 Tax=Kitasatospora albolonga TaxID=68173 RepID=UPI0031F07E47